MSSLSRQYFQQDDVYLHFYFLIFLSFTHTLLFNSIAFHDLPAFQLLWGYSYISSSVLVFCCSLCIIDRFFKKLHLVYWLMLIFFSEYKNSFQVPTYAQLSHRNLPKAFTHQFIRDRLFDSPFGMLFAEILDCFLVVLG